MNDKKVAVIMSTYNGERFVAEQLDSILNQTYSNIEIVVRDDGSKDNTVNIIKEYQKKYTTAGKYILTYLMVILKYFKNRLMNYKEIFSKHTIFVKKEMSISEAITMSSNIIRKKNMIEVLEKFIERKRQDRRMNEEFKC